MAIFPIHHPLVFTFGLLGNIVSFFVYFAPLPTFFKVYKKKSTEGFHSVPYVVALFSAMLWMYYGLINTSAFLLITINSFGCLIECFYIAMYLAYAPRAAKTVTLRLFVALNVVAFSGIVAFTHYAVKGSIRIHVLGWICASLSVSVFAAPLSIMAQVIRTKSVEYMPFNLSLFLTLSAVMWLSYGLLLKDLYVAVPNILGLIFGVVQMVLYGLYRDRDGELKKNNKKQQPGHVINMVSLSTLTPVELHPVDAQKPNQTTNIIIDDQAQTSPNQKIDQSHDDHDHDRDHHVGEDEDGKKLDQVHTQAGQGLHDQEIIGAV
ncbi:bidirectional sugar transporter SWEET15-like [Malania oleifera]|uniref:bidirectional sugar transporter SWEET15-like n=1 Tax=Malania oleifera TaxID=397392 RepID=UPI0025AE995C|nr:bidirectional sugar transporter SWEET15-like [Malania oleifera]